MFLKPFRMLRDGLLWLWYNLRPSPKPPYDPTKNRPAPNIRFLGLWDTVAAYGLPFDELTRAWDAVFPLSFPDHDLSNIVERACHALALDDERLSFQPELWNECEEDYQRKARENGLPPPPPIENRLVQVWFAGMHTNVGGGYPDDGLAHVPLDWMMTEADKAGLKFKPDEREQLKAAADINGKMYDSRQGAGGAYRYMPRNVKALTHSDEENEGDRVIVDLPKIHESVFKRIKNRTEGYAPIGLPDRYVVFKSDGSTISPSGPEAQTLDFVEHPTQAANRANLQEKVWNLVWWKRVFYFISVLVFVALATLPFYGGATHEWERPLSFLSTWIGLLNLFLPGFLGGWIRGCQRHPGLFSALALLFLPLLFIGSKLQLRIFDRMRVLWKPTFTWPIVTEPVAETPQGFLFNLRTNSAYQWIANTMKTVVLPFLAGAVMVVVLMIVLARGLYTVADSFGCFCTPATSDKSVFKTNDPCWDSGNRLEEGKRYRITIAVQANDLWKDDTIEPKDMGGFGRELMVPAMYLGIPLRRQFQENWFKPIARIGRLGGDEYPLDGLMPNENTLVAEIKARRSGELFLFVNDTVGFYSNNHGSATVNIERLD